MDFAVVLVGLFAVGVVVFILGIVTRRPITNIAGAKLMATAVVGFPLVSAITRLINSPLPADAAFAWRAFDILFSVSELLLAVAGLVWIVRLPAISVDR